MTIKQLREWLFQNSKEDQWWVCFDSVTEEIPMALGEIEGRLANGGFQRVLVMHVSHAEMAHPTWMELEPLNSGRRTALKSVSQKTSMPRAPAGRLSKVPRMLPDSKQSPSEILGFLILFSPVVFSILAWFWVGEMSLVQNPDSMLSLLTIGTVLLTGVLSGVEASWLGIGSKSDVDEKGRRRTGPIAWTVFIFLFWLFGYPAYLYHRSRYGVKNLLIAAVLVVLIFIWSVVTVNEAIEARQDVLRAAIQNGL